MPGFAPSQGSSYSQMKADTLNQLSAGQRARNQSAGPSLDQFKQTFNSIQDPIQKYMYWNSLPNQGRYDPYTSTIPGFGQWVNDMEYNQTLNGAPVSGQKYSLLGR
jgi:hypothetical protein